MLTGLSAFQDFKVCFNWSEERVILSKETKMWTCKIRIATQGTNFRFCIPIWFFFQVFEDAVNHTLQLSCLCMCFSYAHLCPWATKRRTRWRLEQNCPNSHLFTAWVLALLFGSCSEMSEDWWGSWDWWRSKINRWSFSCQRFQVCGYVDLPN